VRADFEIIGQAEAASRQQKAEKNGQAKVALLPHVQPPRSSSGPSWIADVSDIQIPGDVNGKPE
jgi:hypothetical protein